MNEETGMGVADEVRGVGGEAREERGAPPALVAAFVVSLGNSLGLSALLALQGPLASVELTTLLIVAVAVSNAVSLGALALAIAGARQLVRRNRGVARTGAQLVLGSAITLGALQLLSSIMWGALFRNLVSSSDWTTMMHAWLSLVATATWLGLSAGLVLVGGARVRVLAVPLVVATLLTHSAGHYDDFIPSHLRLCIEVIHTGLALLVLRRGAAATDGVIQGASASRTAELLRQAGRAHSMLTAILATEISLLFWLIGGNGGELVAYVGFYCVPLATLIAGAVLIRSILCTAELPLPRSVRRWLHASAVSAVVVISSWSLDLHHLRFEGALWIFPLLMLVFSTFWSMGLYKLVQSLAPAALSVRATLRHSGIFAALAHAFVLLIACFVAQRYPVLSLFLAGLALAFAQLALRHSCRTVSLLLREDVSLLPAELPAARLV